MMKTFNSIVDNQRGATIVYVGVILTMLVMFTALAVDVGHLYAVRNELQDAADAGALAGASVLFNETGDLQASIAHDEAGRIVNLNKTGNSPVVVRSIEIGHWSFHQPAERTFYPSPDDAEQTEWLGKSAVELDEDTGFINAVKVITERTDTPSFFARIFGRNNFLVSSEAVAYIGFPGNFQPGDLDEPIAVCWQSISDGDKFSCEVGRMINSGNDASTSNSGAWTNFSQPCATATGPTVRPLICSGGNQNEVNRGEGIGTTNGELQGPVFDNIMRCWEEATNKERNWPLTLPVIDCPDNSISPCSTLITAVKLDVIWINRTISEGNNKYRDVPRQMTQYGEDGNVVQEYSCTDSDGFTCWQRFVDTFNLKNGDGRPTGPTDIEGYEQLYQHDAIYFLPSCEEAEPTGGTGGSPANVPAAHPVLVD